MYLICFAHFKKKGHSLYIVFYSFIWSKYAIKVRHRTYPCPHGVVRGSSGHLHFLGVFFLSPLNFWVPLSHLFFLSSDT